MTMQLLLKLSAVVFFTPGFLLPGISLALAGGVVGHIYMKAQLSIKREMSVAKAPVLGHFGAAMAGLGGFLGGVTWVGNAHAQFDSVRSCIRCTGQIQRRIHAPH